MSERNIDGGLKAAAQSDEFNYFLAVDLAFPSGTVYAHNSIGTISFGGNDYLGVGGLGSIDMIRESKTLVDQPINIILSGVDSDLIESLKTDDIYGREANIYIGVLTQDGELVGVPDNWIAGYMDSISVVEGDTDSISVKVQTKASRLLRKNNKRWTIEDHQQDYPGDTFFLHLPYIVTFEPRWGGDLFKTYRINNDEDNSSGGRNWE